MSYPVQSLYLVSKVEEVIGGGSSGYNPITYLYSNIIPIPDSLLAFQTATLYYWLKAPSKNFFSGTPIASAINYRPFLFYDNSGILFVDKWSNLGVGQMRSGQIDITKQARSTVPRLFGWGLVIQPQTGDYLSQQWAGGIDLVFPRITPIRTGRGRIVY